jgi:hypothetical protein
MNLTDTVFRWAFRRNKDGWILMQRANRYELEAIEFDSDADAYRIKESDEYLEDNVGMMHTLFGVPFGLASDQGRPVVDIDAAQTASGIDHKITDGGTIDLEQRMSIQDIMDHFKIGTVQTSQGPAHIVNPFHATHDEEEIVDIRPTARLFGTASDPDTPRKAAKNAIEAERATQGMDLGQLGYWVQIVGSFLMGAIVTEYIAGSSGGGGIDVPLQVGSLAISVLPSVGL